MSNVCADCIGEGYLREEIEQSGEVVACDYCQSEEAPAIDFDDLAEQIHSVLKEHFYMTSPDPEGIDLLAAKEGCWEQPGELVTNAIMNLIDSSEELAEAIRGYLSESYDPSGGDAMIDPCPYASDSQYEERAIDTYEFQESWNTFRQEILSRSRFFNPIAKSALEHLFIGVDKFVTRQEGPVVRILNSSDSIYRARLTKSHENLEETLKKAPESLGAPTGVKSQAGRMNAEGISVFYGATDIDTCIAEIRAPVGSYVVIGQFIPLRDLRILDLTRLQEVYLRGSIFDPEHIQSISRVQFLKHLEGELSRPILPGSESRDYLPTQAVAEYLGSHPDMALDGIMFSSSQVPRGLEKKPMERQVAQKNIVLFSHACQLDSYSVPEGTEIDVSLHTGDPDDPNFECMIWERVPEENPKENKKDDNLISMFQFSPVPTEPEYLVGPYEPSLSLNMESIEIREIQGVKYQTIDIEVSRHRIAIKESEI
ncbi:MAG: RES family NAD+ phosphorylase [Gammaproteobacteria bacterium]|nr:RES family NAD+ phosphorylase [Gammaproteobacteria bacterium]